MILVISVSTDSIDVFSPCHDHLHQPHEEGFLSKYGSYHLDFWLGTAECLVTTTSGFDRLTSQLSLHHHGIAVQNITALARPKLCFYQLSEDMFILAS